MHTQKSTRASKGQEAAKGRNERAMKERGQGEGEGLEGGRVRLAGRKQHTLPRQEQPLPHDVPTQNPDGSMVKGRMGST